MSSEIILLIRFLFGIQLVIGIIQRLKAFSRNADHLIEQLKIKIKKLSPKNIIVAGSSMGAYAALLFGVKVGANRIVAVAPQTRLHPNIPHSPKVVVKYDDLQRVIAEKSNDTQVEIWFGAESALDLFNCLRIPSSETIHHKIIPGAMHNVLASFKRRGLLDNFIKHIASGTAFECDRLEMDHDKIETIVKAGYLFYEERNYDKVIALLEPIECI